MDELKDDFNELEKLKLNFDHLEKRYDDSAKFFKIILSSITLIFLFLGIIITILSIASKGDIENAINRMESRFEKLAGQSIKEPRIEVFYEGNPVSNTTNILKLDESKFSIKGYYIKNIGLRTATNIKLKIYSESKISDIIEKKGESGYYSGLWQYETSSIDEYPFLYVYHDDLQLNPSEPFSLGSILLIVPKETLIEQNISCKLQVFYDSQPPTIVSFILSK